MSLTLITICWNSGNFLRRCVESVLRQQCRPDEYIFVDGGSTDATLPLLQELCPQLEAAGVRASLIHQQRWRGEAGIPSAWNQGIALASGDVIALLNSDDWYEPQALQQVVQAFTANPSCDAVVAPIILVDGPHRRLLRPAALGWLPVKMTIPHPGCFFRSRVYQQLGLYDARYRIAADYEFICRCRQSGICWQQLTEPLVQMQAGGAAQTNRAVARAETLQIGRRYFPWSPLPWLAWLARHLTGR